MATENKYKVKGIYEGKKIDAVVNAYSARQAKFKASLESGFFGDKVGGFINSSKVRVSRK